MIVTTTWLQCAECNEMFEVSSAVAKAMHDWRKESGDPFLCVECVTRIESGDAISVMDGETAGKRQTDAIDAA